MTDQVGSAPGGEGAPKRSKLAWAIAPVLIFVLFAVLFGFALKSGDPTRLPSALIGRPAPAVTFAAIGELIEDGHDLQGFGVSDLATGKPIVVNFWASWCVPCVQEHPLLTTLKTKAGVDIYGVNYKDQADAARRFIGRYGNPFTRLGSDPHGRGAIEWGVYGMPETFVVNGRGQIVYKHVGALTPESIESKIIPAIEAARQSETGKTS
jgi:cytochrome c biogenesis protein CcmG/thiol:disulfide interchange protein DsbE